MSIGNLHFYLKSKVPPIKLIDGTKRGDKFISKAIESLCILVSYRELLLDDVYIIAS